MIDAIDGPRCSASLRPVTAQLSFTSKVPNEVRGQTGWWRLWPSWVGFVASVWALVYGCVVLAAAAAGRRQFVDVAYLAWPAAVALLGGAVAAAAATRGPRRRLSRRAVSVAVWTVAVLSRCRRLLPNPHEAYLRLVRSAVESSLGAIGMTGAGGAELAVAQQWFRFGAHATGNNNGKEVNHTPCHL